ncbi:hypothetical protein PENTCL1PPCAC_4859, partial [Pristionchus entomophagus]
SPKDYAMQLRQMKQKAKEDHQAGVSTVRVVEDAMKKAHPNVLPHVNPAGLAHAVQRYVQVPGMLEWPATIDPSQFNFRFLRQDNCDRFQRGEPTALKLLFSEFGKELLINNPDWSVDGTFYAAPVEFEQILI